MLMVFLNIFTVSRMNLFFGVSGSFTLLQPPTLTSGSSHDRVALSS